MVPIMVMRDNAIFNCPKPSVVNDRAVTRRMAYPKKRETNMAITVIPAPLAIRRIKRSRSSGLDSKFIIHRFLKKLYIMKNLLLDLRKNTKLIQTTQRRNRIALVAPDNLRTMRFRHAILIDSA